MGAWLDITAEQLNADGRFTGIEPEALTLKSLSVHLAAAKHSLRRRARTAFRPLYQEHAITETGLFDAVASLGSTGDTADLYEDLRQLLRLETLSMFYSNLKGKRGQRTSLDARARGYASDASDGLPAVADKIWDAIDNADLILTSDITQRRGRVHWTA